MNTSAGIRSSTLTQDELNTLLDNVAAFAATSTSLPGSCGADLAATVLGSVKSDLNVSDLQTGPGSDRPTMLELSEFDHLVADLADDFHRFTRHHGGLCDGESDGCEGGPDTVDAELGDDAFDLVLTTLNLREPFPLDGYRG